MKVLTVVGARPQFIKAAALSRAFSATTDISEVMIHTGQHFDSNMSQIFFSELDIPEPAYNLAISGGTHGAMTGRMLEALETVFIAEKPDWVLIYGDTNSTLAAALAAAKLHLPIVHVEAGLRSFNMRMPEEVNRIVADRLSTLLFCPTNTAVENLKNEGIVDGVSNVGDVMYDVALFFGARAERGSDVLQRLSLRPGNFALATCHRAENTDDRQRLTEILTGLSEIARTVPVVLPLHPRTRKLVDQYALNNLLNRLVVTDPLPYLDMVALEKNAKAIITDSGGVQKEAFFYHVPCITMRDETEWVETVELGWNRLTGASAARITEAFASSGAWPSVNASPYGDGNTTGRIITALRAGAP